MNDCKVLRYDYEIVRGVECCFRDQVECDNCPYKGIENCEAILKGEVATFLESKLGTIDYILEQWNNAEKEIKGLKKSNRNWRRKVQRLRSPFIKMYEQFEGKIKSEAYKEVWGELRSMCNAPHWCVWLSEIDDFFEKLVGDKNESKD